MDQINFNTYSTMKDEDQEKKKSFDKYFFSTLEALTEFKHLIFNNDKLKRLQSMLVNNKNLTEESISFGKNEDILKEIIKEPNNNSNSNNNNTISNNNSNF